MSGRKKKGVLEMNVLLINGSPHEKGCTYTALKEVAEELNRQGIESNIFFVGKNAVHGCTGCGYCKREGNGRCVYQEDPVNECLALAEKADGIILGAPVHYAAISGMACSFFDRLFMAKKSFWGKVGAGVVSCRRGGATAAFDQLNKYFTISSMPVVSSQYWNQVHGNTPEEVRKDLEGLQTMRTLAQNMAWLLKCIEAGKASVERPKLEEPVKTNFIR